MTRPPPPLGLVLEHRGRRAGGRIGRVRAHVADRVEVGHHAVVRDRGREQGHLHRRDADPRLAERRARQLHVIGEGAAVAIGLGGHVAGGDRQGPPARADGAWRAEAEAMGVLQESLGPQLETDVREEDVARHLERGRQGP